MAKHNGPGSQPVVVYGGDFNNQQLEWIFCIRDAMETQHTRRTVLLCTSKAIPFAHGDQALVFNAFAAKEDSGFGKSYTSEEYEPISDGHDVVLVPLCWNHLQSPSSAAPPAVLPLLPAATEDAQPEAEPQVNIQSNASSSAARTLSPAWSPDLATTAQTCLLAAQHCLLGVSSSVGRPASPASSVDAGLSVTVPAIGNANHIVELFVGEGDRAASHVPIAPLDTNLGLAQEEAFSTQADIFQAQEYLRSGDDELPPELTVPPALDDVVAASSLVLPSPETPLYNDFLDKLAITDDDDVMKDLADLFVFDTLRSKRPYGSAEPPAGETDDPYALGLRTEHLLNITNTHRSRHIARLTSRNDDRAQTPHTLVFTSDDMREIMNAWRKQPETWSDSLATLNGMRTAQEHHLACKSKFNTMLFQMYGSKSLVEIFIRFPICSVEQPASLLRSFAQSWQAFHNSSEADRARQNSQPNDSGNPRLSKQIYALQQRQERARWIARWIDEDWNNWYKLKEKDRLLWNEYSNGDITREIQKLRSQQQSRFPGAAEIIATSMQSLSPLP